MRFISAIQFHAYKFYVNSYVDLKSMIGQPWKKVETIWLPLLPEIGFNTVRWIVNGRYEEGEIAIVKQTLAADDIVLEIGTGLGFVSSYCSAKIGSDRVFTFEGNPLNVAMANKVFEKNQVSPKLKNAVLGMGSGMVDFPVDEQHRLGSSMLREGKMRPVPLVDLNETIRVLQPTYLVMDIEGAEYNILKMISMQSIVKLQFELHPAVLGKAKCNEIFMILKAGGFMMDDKLCHGNNFYCYKTRKEN
ncbi:MAG: FkbM family methyltransferase [Ferruginibacter sp.]|nr:FkbM family methyltransferase [Ferruginibacter sp.]